jgi:hypothetical protein
LPSKGKPRWDEASLGSDTRNSIPAIIWLLLPLATTNRSPSNNINNMLSNFNQHKNVSPILVLFDFPNDDPNSSIAHKVKKDNNLLKL